MDLALLKELASDNNQAIRKVGTTALYRHLWYLSEVTVGLALFDDEVPNLEKSEMVHCMNTVVGIEEPSLQLQYSSGDVVKKGPMESFTGTTKSLLHNLEIDSSFLDSDPELCANREACARVKVRISMQMVANDAAERSVALIQITNNGMTKISSRPQSK